MSRMTDLSGNKYGRLTALKPTFKDGRYAWECACDCGQHTVVLRNNIVTGRTQSCGCLASELTTKRNLLMNTEQFRKHLSHVMMNNTNGCRGRRRIVKLHKENKDEQEI